MYYNAAKNALIEVNGNVVLSWDQTTELLGVSTTSIKTMTANSGTGIYDKLIIDADLGVRLHTSEIRYHFNSDTTNDVMASGILFQYKNEDFQNYTTLPTFFDQDYYYTNTSGTLFAPRYVKLTHDLSETEGFLTTLSGYVIGELYGFEIINDDTYVDFGSDGIVVGDTITVAKEATADIREIQIYNSGLNKSTAYVSLDPTYTNLDEVMSVSLTEDGIWVYPMDENLIIMNAGETDDYGICNNTHLKNGVIGPISYSDVNDRIAINIENGNYTSKIFFDGDTTWNSLIIDRILPLNGAVQVDSNDGTETIQVRSSKLKPKSYHIYRELYTSTISTTDYLRYRDKWVETDEIKTTSAVNLLSATYYTIWQNFLVVVDPITERWGGFAYHYADSEYVTAQWYLLNVYNDSVVSKLMAQQSGIAASMIFDWKYLKFDYEGGIWTYFYGSSYRDSDFVDETGYYLCYFDNSLTEKFRYFKTTEFVGAMDVDYSTKHLWYTMPESNQLQKIDFDGTVLYNHYENTDTLGGLCVLSDGTVWYANSNDLHKISSEGVIEEDIEDVADELFVQLTPAGDGTEFLWALENFYISRVIISGDNKGTKEFSIYVNYASKLYPVDSGVWVWCADLDNPGDAYMRHISKDTRIVDKEYKIDYNSTYGMLEYTYDDKYYTNKMPLSIDQEWLNLAWEKVNIESFILPEDKYHQAKITLRRQTPYQKYGSAVTLDSTFYTDDNFNQAGISPDIMVWGDRLSDERVYIEDNQLVMLNDLTGDYDSYINTKDKYVLTGDFDVQFDYIMGDGIQTNKGENIYLYAYATDDGVWGQYIMSRIYIPSSLSSTSYIYYYINSGYNQTSLGTNYDRWTGKLRLKRSGNNVYGYVWDPQASSWKGNYRAGVNVLGNYFYLQMLTARTGSDVYIDNWTVNAGIPYYYTGTPKMKGIYTRKEVEVKDIYPNTSKGVYLKSYVSQGLEVEDHYDTALRVRWRTPIN